MVLQPAKLVNRLFWKWEDLFAERRQKNNRYHSVLLATLGILTIHTTNPDA